jgi:hypothetical protein
VRVKGAHPATQLYEGIQCGELNTVSRHFSGSEIL